MVHKNNNMRYLEERLRRLPKHRSLNSNQQKRILAELQVKAEKKEQFRRWFRPAVTGTVACFSLLMLIGIGWFVYTGLPPTQNLSAEHNMIKSQSKSEASNQVMMAQDRAANLSEGVAEAQMPQASMLDKVPVEQMKAIEMIDPKNGWLLASTGVYVTKNGGFKWTRVTPSIKARSLDGMVAEFAGKAAWIVAPGKNTMVVYKTDNLGKTWEKTSVGPQRPQQTDRYLYGNISITDREFGGLVVREHVPNVGKKVQLYQSADSGRTWSKVSGKGIAKDRAHRDIKNGISFINNEVGWVTGKRAGSSAVYLYKTRNNGESWKKEVVPVPKGENALTKEPIIFSDYTTYVPVRIDKGSSYGLYFLCSANQGKSWTETEMIPVSGQFTAWDFINPDMGYVATTGSLYYTLNGGKTWGVRALSVNLSVVDISFYNKSNGILITPTHMYETTNGGQTWEVIKTLNNINHSKD